MALVSMMPTTNTIMTSQPKWPVSLSISATRLELVDTRPTSAPIIIVPALPSTTPV